jgi:HK97 family phage portal protein
MPSFLDRLLGREQRNVEDPTKPVSAAGLYDWLHGVGGRSAADVVVNTTTALQVPAVSAAVNFLSGTLASLPIHVYRNTRKGREQVKASTVAKILEGAANIETSKYDLIRNFYFSVLTHGRGYIYIERNGNTGRVEGLYNLDPRAVRPERVAGRTRYTYQIDQERSVVYQASEIIDVAYQMQSDGVTHISPIQMNKDVIGLGIAATQYGARFFAGGGVPPFVVSGSFKSESALIRAGADLREAVRKAAKEQRTALTMPEGLEIKPIGSDPERAQMVDTQRFIVEQVSRIYDLPPSVLHDLSHGTYSNVEQQGLALAKHVITRYAVQLEQQLNLKLFGLGGPRFVEVSLKGLQRGAFSERMDGYRTAINAGFMTPAEVRRLENLPEIEGSDELFMQGANVPLNKLGEVSEPAPAPQPQQPQEEADDE